MIYLFVNLCKTQTMKDIIKKYLDWKAGGSDATLLGTEKITFRIAADMNSRPGLGQEWRAIDVDTQAEILEAWKDIITEEVVRSLQEVILEHNIAAAVGGKIL